MFESRSKINIHLGICLPDVNNVSNVNNIERLDRICTINLCTEIHVILI